MDVAVLGGGLQGCSAALALAERGARVALYDRNASLLSRAGVANEGKIHLGYMYANDPGLSTARVMMRGALAFQRFFARHLGSDHAMQVSEPAVYVLHHDSQRSEADVSRYLAAVHALVREAASETPDAYFGIDLQAGLRQWTAAEMETSFNRELVDCAFSTPEVAIDPSQLAAAVRDSVAAHPRIDVRLGHFVEKVAEEGERLAVASTHDGAYERRAYDHVVNALWDGRLAIDRTMGLRPSRRWLHRLKYGVSFRHEEKNGLLSATIISGPFGEVVSYGRRLTYLTWYPACLQGMSDDLAPPDWPTYPEEPLHSRLIAGTLAGLADIMPALRDIDLAKVSDISVKGGVIVAWGETDINDPRSELHRRFDIGVTSVGRFHSVDPGKLTMAPYFADVCAARIFGD